MLPYRLYHSDSLGRLNMLCILHCFSECHIFRERSWNSFTNNVQLQETYVNNDDFPDQIIQNPSTYETQPEAPLLCTQKYDSCSDTKYGAAVLSSKNCFRIQHPLRYFSFCLFMSKGVSRLLV